MSLHHKSCQGCAYDDAASSSLVITNEETRTAIHVPIASRGLLELAHGLIAKALKAMGEASLLESNVLTSKEFIFCQIPRAAHDQE